MVSLYIIPLHDHILTNIPSFMSQMDIGIKGFAHVVIVISLRVFFLCCYHDIPCQVANISTVCCHYKKRIKTRNDRKSIINWCYQGLYQHNKYRSTDYKRRRDRNAQDAQTELLGLVPSL